MEVCRYLCDELVELGMFVGPRDAQQSGHGSHGRPGGGWVESTTIGITKSCINGNLAFSPAKRTNKDSKLRESMTLNSVWQGMDLQEKSEETHAKSLGRINIIEICVARVSYP